MWLEMADRKDSAEALITATQEQPEHKIYRDGGLSQQREHKVQDVLRCP